MIINKRVWENAEILAKAWHVFAQYRTIWFNARLSHDVFALTAAACFDLLACRSPTLEKL